MCGIAGFFDGNADFTANREKYENILQKMQQSILHRGPDEQGIYLGKRAGLAHTRLSIIDLKDGSQPMSRRRGKNSYQIVYNGEIYNAGELRKMLQQKGWRFQTTSDTEVILLAFLEYGPEFVIRLNGIFAFAILDVAAFVNVMHHLCKRQHDFRLAERDFQQFHHLIIGQFSRTDQKTFQHSGTSAKTMHALFSVQL